MLASLLFNGLSTAVLHVAVNRFGANADAMKAMVSTTVRDEKAGGGGGQRNGEINPRTLWRTRNRSGERCVQTAQALFPGGRTVLQI